MAATIIIGYGNPDRQDDGAAWHVLAGLAKRLGRKASQWPEDVFDISGENPDLYFNLQLTPELADTVSRYERVCFVDAHTGSIPHDLNITTLQPLYQASPFTHHMTPETCLTLVETLYHTHPESLLVSVRGYQFDFSHELSEKTQGLVNQAIEAILEWLG